MIILANENREFAVPEEEMIRMLYSMEKNVPGWEVPEEEKKWIRPFTFDDPDLKRMAETDEVIEMKKENIREDGEYIRFEDYPIGFFTGRIVESDGLDTDDYYYFELLIEGESVMISLTTVGICLYFAWQGGTLVGNIPKAHHEHFAEYSEDFIEFYEFSTVRRRL